MRKSVASCIETPVYTALAVFTCLVAANSLHSLSTQPVSPNQLYRLNPTSNTVSTPALPSHYHLSQQRSMAISSASAVVPLTPASGAATLSAGDVRGIVREVLGELLPTSSGRSSGPFAVPLLGTGGGEWYYIIQV